MRWLAAVLCLALSLACVAALPQIERRQRLLYSLKEPFFTNPAPNKTGILHIRSDSYGKGYFGASRNGGRTHKGIDVLSPVGASVLAAKSGRIFFAGEDKGYGLYVEMHHPDGFYTRYAHLSQMDVKTGQWVEMGAVIGKTGKTGNAKNPHIVPHVHFEIRQGDDAVNPAGLLDPSILVK